MKQFATISFAILLSTLTACSSQAKPETKTTSAEVKSTTDASDKTAATEEKAEKVPAPSIVRGSSQSVGTRATVYVLKVAVTAAVSYFVTKAIVDAVKDEATSDD